VGMVTTIAVTFITVFPSVSKGYVEEINGLKQTVSDLKKGQNPGNSSDSPDKNLIIHGTVKSKDGKQTLNGFDVYFLPEGNSQLTTRTDDSGKFYKEMAPGTYSIIVREATNGASGKGILDEDQNELTVQGAIVHYRMNRR
jgi:hypothetical protein